MKKVYISITLTLITFIAIYTMFAKLTGISHTPREILYNLSQAKMTMSLDVIRKSTDYIQKALKAINGIDVKFNPKDILGSIKSIGTIFVSLFNLLKNGIIGAFYLVSVPVTAAIDITNAIIAIFKSII